MWNLIRKDLVRRWRSPVSTLVMLAFPVMMTLMIAPVSSTGGGDQVPRIKILIVDQDGGFLTNVALGALGNGQGAESLDLVTVELEEGQSLMNAGKASAMVIFPEGFTQAVLDSEETTLQVVRNPREGILPEVVELGAGYLATLLDTGSVLLGPQVNQATAMFEQDEWPQSSEVEALAASTFAKMQGLQKFLLPPVVSLESIKEAYEDERSAANVYGFILVMITVMALLFIASNSMNDLWEELESGMLRRQMGTTLGLSEIVFAKVVFGLALGLVALSILLVFGALLGWFQNSVDLLGLVVMSVAFLFAAGGVMTLVIGASKTQKQAAFLSWVVIMGMSALGGSMGTIPVQQVARFTINYWAIDGLQEVLIFGEGTGEILKHALILTAAGLVTGIVGHRVMVARFAKVAP